MKRKKNTKEILFVKVQSRTVQDLDDFERELEKLYDVVICTGKRPNKYEPFIGGWHGFWTVMEVIHNE